MLICTHAGSLLRSVSGDSDRSLGNSKDHQLIVEVVFNCKIWPHIRKLFYHHIANRAGGVTCFPSFLFVQIHCNPCCNSHSCPKASRLPLRWARGALPVMFFMYQLCREP